MDDGDVEMQNTRTGKARKIDDWSMRLPGGQRAKFAVLMKYKEGRAYFMVESDHPIYGEISIIDDDLNVLRERLSAQMSELIEKERSEAWSPATQVELRHSLGDKDHMGIWFNLSLKLNEVEVIPDEPRGNYGEITVRAKYTQKTVLEREHDADFGALRPLGGLQDPEVKAWLNSPLRHEESRGLARTVVREGQGDPLALARTLEAFSEILGQRVGPMRTGIEGFPPSEDLIDMMRMAVEKTQEHQIDIPRTAEEELKF